MLKQITYLIAILFLVNGCVSPVTQPVIENLDVVMVADEGDLKVRYDAVDQDTDSLSVDIKVKDPANGTYLKVNQKEGDFGYPIAPGKDKTISIALRELSFPVEVQLSISDRTEEKLNHLKDMLDTGRMKTTISRLIGTRNHITNKQHLMDVREYIVDKFQSGGVQVTRQDFTYEGLNGQNIIATIPGKKYPEIKYIVSAHYDTTPNSPGADDNASGVAGMLEAFDILSNFMFDYTIEFIAFDLEEPGSIGSQSYLNVIDNNIEIMGVINLDMIGSYSEENNSQVLPEVLEPVFVKVYDELKANGNKADFILNISSDFSEDLSEAFENSVSEYVENGKVFTISANAGGEFIPMLVASDNASFWNYNISALHIGEGGVTRNPYIDSPDDKLYLLNYGFMSQTTLAVATTIGHLAGLRKSHTASFTLKKNF